MKLTDNTPARRHYKEIKELKDYSYFLYDGGVWFNSPEGTVISISDQGEEGFISRDTLVEEVSITDLVYCRKGV